jgi:hypothetical protein
VLGLPGYHTKFHFLTLFTLGQPRGEESQGAVPWVGWEIWDNRGKQKTLVKSPWVVLSPAAGLLLGLFLRDI